MSLSPGDRFGPYVVIAPIGAGGMGEVWKARDTRLDRVIALKLLPPDRTGDEERKQRFLQEAKAASALNHPNIVTIYDVGSERGVSYLAMEFVQGKTLDQLIARGGMRFSELLRYGVQAADALAKAHQAGIVHRDLKPANVMVSSDGVVKILDFGLAKLTAAAPAKDEETRTIRALTREGVVMGTPFYMSPEQAEAKTVDSRSDIFSFGVVLYEMAAGQRPFTGESQVAILSSILREEPKAPGMLREDIPAELARIILRCLRKDPARRFQNMADLKVALEELKDELDSGVPLTAPAAVKTPGRAIRPWLLAPLAIALVAIGAVGSRFLTPSAPATAAAFNPVPLTGFPGLEDNPSFSPDGNQVAFSWNGDKEGNTDIYVKLIGPGAPLRLTADPAVDTFPRWSPDGRSIAFIRRQASQRSSMFSVFVIPALGGPEKRVGDFATHDSGIGIPLPSACWTPDSKALIVSASLTPGAPNALAVVPLDGGQMKPLTHPGDNWFGDTNPTLSEDGRTLAFLRASDGLEIPFVVGLSAGLEAQGEPQEIELKERQVSAVTWLPGSRELLFANGIANGSGLYRIAVHAGALPALLPGIAPGAYSAAVSRQGHRLAYAALKVDSNFWSVDIAAKTARLERNLSSPFADTFPQFSPDGKRVAFYSNRGGSLQIWTANRDGSQMQQLTSLPGPITASPRWSPDGRQIVFDSNTGGVFQSYIMTADGGRPRLLINDKPAFFSNWSRDGRWVYFVSNRTGESQIWKTQPESGASVQVTHGGGTVPMESPDGKTLYFGQERTGTLWRMPVEGGQETQVLPDVFRANYVVTDGGIYFQTQPAKDGKASIRYFSFVTKVTTEIVSTTEPEDGLTLSPDGRTLMLAQIDYKVQDLMLVENFQ